MSDKELEQLRLLLYDLKDDTTINTTTNIDASINVVTGIVEQKLLGLYDMSK